MVCSNKLSSSNIPFQKPQHSRHFDEDFKDRYSSDTYNYEGQEIVTKTQSGSGNYEEYKKTKPRQKEDNNTDSFTINIGPFTWLFYGAIAIAIVYLIYILFNEGGSSLFTINRDKSINAYHEITADNIENTDIDTLIKQAENEGNYRLAIRYYYLLVLKTLSLKNHIKFEDDKTNSEYLIDIQGKPFSANFEYTSYLYNYIWYGEFPLNIEKYNKAKSNFATLLNQVK